MPNRYQMTHPVDELIEKKKYFKTKAMAIWFFAVTIDHLSEFQLKILYFLYLFEFNNYNNMPFD